VSHDIRSPLSALALVIDSLDNLSPEKSQLVRQIAQRIDGIASDLLSRFVIEGTPRTIGAKDDSTFQSADTFLKNIVAEKRLHVARNLEAIKLIQMRLDLPANESRFSIISHKELSRVLSNIINNSVEALDNGGTIDIALRESTRDFTIIVNDNGCGIPDPVLSKLGQSRVSFGKSAGGTGTGIMHATETVARLGGKMRIQSRIGVGTMVSITLPNNA
jgi:two-component system sporulation sensor kinase A